VLLQSVFTATQGSPAAKTFLFTELKSLVLPDARRLAGPLPAAALSPGGRRLASPAGARSSGEGGGSSAAAKPAGQSLGTLAPGACPLSKPVVVWIDEQLKSILEVRTVLAWLPRPCGCTIPCALGRSSPIGGGWDVGSGRWPAAATRRARRHCICGRCPHVSNAVCSCRSNSRLCSERGCAGGGVRRGGAAGIGVAAARVVSPVVVAMQLYLWDIGEGRLYPSDINEVVSPAGADVDCTAWFNLDGKVRDGANARRLLVPVPAFPCEVGHPPWRR
jgi:hypothetical protein